MPSPEPTRLLEHLHGHLGWLAVAALLHPAILLRRRKRAHLSVGLAVGLVTIVGAMGAMLYEPYRDRIKQALFVNAPSIGYLFERKEHLAFGAIVVAWAAGAAYVGAARAEDEATRDAMRTFAWRGFVIAFVLAAIAAALGVAVAVVKTF